MQIFFTGGSGFVGSHLLSRLTQAGHRVKVLTRRESLRSEITQRGGEVVIGDIMEPAPWENQVEGCDAIINLIGIISESASSTFEELHYQATTRLISIGKQKGLQKFLLMSALGTREGTTIRYFQTKFKAERALKESGLNYIIFRPSIIFGPNDGFVNMLANLIRRSPVVPVIGDGEYEMQPVSVYNVADCFVRGIEKEESLNQTFEIGGPHILTYNKILDEIMEALGVYRRKINLPVSLMKAASGIVEIFLVKPMITREQIAMLLESNICDNRRAIETFQLNLIPFSQGIRDYLKPVG